ncbi:MAG TPA: NADH oxidase, partial [Ruminococcaceae bacterium]|nr:NADH oxidase [Oscillospiraceae bacterium]
MNLLNTPLTVGKIELPNRLVMPPMATEKSTETGEVTEKLCEHYAARTKGGYLGLLFTEHSFISPDGKASKRQLSLSEDKNVAGLKKLVASIHQDNTLVFAQINHAGGYTKREITGHELISASSVQMPGAEPADKLPKAMTQADIQKVVDDFARAAVRAKKAGYDGVEIHSAHGYLLNQFFSPLTNKRNDQYKGTTIAGRIHLHLEVIQAVRKAVGADYPLSLRLGASDYMEGGTTVQDSVAAAKEFEKAGVNLLSISGGFCRFNRPGVKKPGYFSELSEAIKKAVHIPVIVTGGVAKAADAEKLLEDQKADLIGVGRALLKDPEWAKAAIQ